MLDPSGEGIVVRDEANGALVAPTAHVVRDDGVYVARHGFGYSRFEHAADGLALELTQFVPLDRRQSSPGSGSATPPRRPAA